MLQYAINYLWHDLFAWVGVCGLTMIVAGYLILTTPSPFIRHAAVVAFTIAACVLVLYPKAYKDGADHVVAQVKRQEAQLRERGDHARADALSDAAAGVRDPWDYDGDEH